MTSYKHISVFLLITLVFYISMAAIHQRCKYLKNIICNFPIKAEFTKSSGWQLPFFLRTTHTDSQPQIPHAKKHVSRTFLRTCANLGFTSLHLQLFPGNVRPALARDHDLVVIEAARPKARPRSGAAGRAGGPRRPAVPGPD